MGVSRRQFLGGMGLGIASAILVPSGWRYAEACKLPAGKQGLTYASFAGPGGKKMASRFYRWLGRHGIAKDKDVRGLVFESYDTAARRGTAISTTDSAMAILWFLQRGKITRATSIANALMRWQQSSRYGALESSFGAFPESIDRAEEAAVWRASDTFHSGSNLAILEAFTTLYENTKDPELLNASTGVGTWLSDVMCKGHDRGLWAENHGAPMRSVDRAGKFTATIHANLESMWIHSLGRLGALTKEEGYCSAANSAIQFYRRGQSKVGAFLDHYDPGSPPTAFHSSRWAPAETGKLMSDRALLAALGACRSGYLDAGRRFFDWLQVSKGRVPAIIDAKTGGHGFASEEQPYYDTLSSGLYRQLAQWLGKQDQALQSTGHLRKTQQKNGGFYASLYSRKLKKLNARQSSIAGLWATADISVVGAKLA